MDRGSLKERFDLEENKLARLLHSCHEPNTRCLEIHKYSAMPVFKHIFIEEPAVSSVVTHIVILKTMHGFDFIKGVI